MGRWQRGLALLLCAVLACATLSGCQLPQRGATDEGSTNAEVSASVEKTSEPREMPTVALMPLDSRPCNTQYPQLLAQAAEATLVMPDSEDMDSFLQSADQDALWRWLEEQSQTADDLVIFTNSLFSGGLIASRSADGYDTVDEDLDHLRQICNEFRQHSDGTITIVQVLPRLQPNQFDSTLAPYGKALKAYGQSWDEADAAGQEAPSTADGVPDEILAVYKSLHERSANLAQELNLIAAEGLIDQLVISQDDGDTLCPANIAFRALKKALSDNTTLTHGADELSMLLVSGLLAQDEKPTQVHVVYSSDSSRTDIYPYESVSLQEMIKQKLALGGLEEADADADYTLYVHAKTDDLRTTTNFIAAFNSYLGIADVAMTNQQDPALEEWLLNSEYFDNVDAYAGWNTAGNSIGTVCSVMRISNLLDNHFDELTKEQKETAARNIFAFRAVRYAEDSCYMANIRQPLQDELLQNQLMKSTSAFVDNDAWAQGNQLLAEAYAPYNTKLADVFNGDHTLYLGEHQLDCSISNFASSMQFPWARAFEVYANVSMDVTVDEDE
ncbi:MAG: DUF4127 family protein [Peptococcaceae bacterium]|nr:DUF4127 family protein [Peptococcaceae bacterium]